VILTEWRREREIRKTLKALTRQRVVRILQPGIAWIIERAVTEGNEGVADSLRTCHLRGRVEIVSDAVPNLSYVPGARGLELTPARTAPMYRLTDAGWTQIRRTHAWVIATFVVALAFLFAAMLVPWIASHP
jgi:hypothetical protein